MSDWTDDYKRLMREFMERRGAKIEVSDRYDWEDADAVSTYGWHDYQAGQHVRPAEGQYPGDGCHWIVPEGAVLYERTYSMFTDTFHDNQDEVGINVKGCHCACGKYADVILRFDGSLADVMRELTGAPKSAEVTL